MLLTDGNGSKKECTKVKPYCRASEENKYIDFMSPFIAEKYWAYHPSIESGQAFSEVINQISNGRQYVSAFCT